MLMYDMDNRSWCIRSGELDKEIENTQQSREENGVSVFLIHLMPL